MDKKGDERCRHAVKRSSKFFALVEKLDAPVVLTVAAKGVVPEEHPLCIGANLPFEPVQSLIKTADVVLVVGTELAETDLDPFKASIDVDETLIRVDLDPEQLVKNQRPDVGIWSDSKLALSEILKALGGEEKNADRDQTPGTGRVAEIRSEIRKQWWQGSERHNILLDALRAVLPDEGIVTTVIEVREDA